MIEVDRLSKSFGDRSLWRNVSFDVNSGEVLALVGASGSGKTSLLNCLGLLDAPNSGAIRYENRDITRFSKGETRRFRRDALGYLFQHYALIENATIEENLEIAAKPQRKLELKARISESLDQVGLKGRAKETVYHLSGGEQQRVALARLLVKKPRLVLADEPTGALDHDNTVMVVDILREMSAAGCAVVIATHDDGVRNRCDRVLAIREGSVKIEAN